MQARQLKGCLLALTWCCAPVSVLSVLQLPLDTLLCMLNRFTADDCSKEGIPAGGVLFVSWVSAHRG
jgi:hypothetical protein